MIICSSNGVGCSGQVVVRLTWHNLQQIHPHIAVDLDLNPLQLQLHPHHLPLLSKVAQCLNESAQHAQHDGQSTAQSSVGTAQREVGFVAGARKYVENALVPNFEQVAQDVADQLYWRSEAVPPPASFSNSNASRGQSPLAESEMFQDAQSMMGSVRTTFNSFLSSTAASLGSSQLQPASSSSSANHHPPGTAFPSAQTGSLLDDQDHSNSAGQQPKAAKPQVHRRQAAALSFCSLLAYMSP